MTAPFRFLGLAAMAWVGVRAASLGMFPGATALDPPSDPSTMSRAPLAQSQLVQPYDGVMTPPMNYSYFPAGYQPAPYPMPPVPYGYQPRIQPIYLAAPSPAPVRTNGWDAVMPLPQPLAYAEIDHGSWPVPTGVGAQAAPKMTFPASAAPPRFDRWQFSTWAMMRRGATGTSLANGGTLGGSQGGARLTYRFNDHLGVAARFSSALGGRRGAEAALGVRWQPLASVPVALNVERRQKLGRFGGRSDFAAFAEGGLYQRPITGKLKLDGYAQAGIVGMKSRDWFADGAVSVSHPIWNRFSGGVGVWAGGQRDAGLGAIYRVDAGPRLSVDLYRGTRLHLDYRQRLVGNALPGSGPTVTFAGDF